MILVVVTLLAVGVAMLRGGRFERLAALSLRFAPVILLALLIQLLLFNPVVGPYFTRAQTALAYNVSMLLILGTLFLNWRVAGLPVAALGVFLNWLVITLNGGFMPASPSALLAAGLVTEAELSAGHFHNNSILLDAGTRLPLLADIFAVPAFLPLSNVFSPGDVVLAVGVAWLIYATMRAPHSNLRQ